ncbi:MAG: PAS domain-containing protein [Nitrospira sp.]
MFDWDLAAHNGVWSPELERIWGLPVGGFDGTADAWRRLVHPDDRGSAYAGTQRSLSNPMTASEFEYRIVRPDGATRWIYAKAKTLCDSEGQRRGWSESISTSRSGRSAVAPRAICSGPWGYGWSRTRDLVQSQERLRALTTELNLAEQRERKRLATDLHDYLQQLLVFGKLTIARGRQANDVLGYEAVEEGR